MDNNLTSKTKKALHDYPVLEKAVEDFIKNDGCSPEKGHITDLTYYIKVLDIEKVDIVNLFGWDKIDLAEEDDECYTLADDFYSWGHNSRYANVLEPELIRDLNTYVGTVIELLDELKEEEGADFKEPDLFS